MAAMALARGQFDLAGNHLLAAIADAPHLARVLVPRLWAVEMARGGESGRRRGTRAGGDEAAGPAASAAAAVERVREVVAAGLEAPVRASGHVRLAMAEIDGYADPAAALAEFVAVAGGADGASSAMRAMEVSASDDGDRAAVLRARCLAAERMFGAVAPASTDDTTADAADDAAGVALEEMAGVGAVLRDCARSLALVAGAWQCGECAHVAMGFSWLCDACGSWATARPAELEGLLGSEEAPRDLAGDSWHVARTWLAQTGRPALPASAPLPALALAPPAMPRPALAATSAVQSGEGQGPVSESEGQRPVGQGEGQGDVTPPRAYAVAGEIGRGDVDKKGKALS